MKIMNIRQWICYLCQRLDRLEEKIGNGTQGQVTHIGHNPPSDGLGVDGDLYYNLTHGEYYRKIGDKWTHLGSTKIDGGRI